MIKKLLRWVFEERMDTLETDAYEKDRESWRKEMILCEKCKVADYALATLGYKISQRPMTRFAESDEYVAPEPSENFGYYLVNLKSNKRKDIATKMPNNYETIF